MESKNITQKDLTNYNSRIWLNPPHSDATSSIVCYDGSVTDIDTGKIYVHRFVEISSCKTKSTIHQTSDNTIEDFINKLKVMRNELDLFINHLEQDD